jgi:carboxyl-terminal processing protease
MRRSTVSLVLLGLLTAAPAADAQQADSTVPPAVVAALRHVLAQGYVTPMSADSLARFSSADSMLLALQDRHTVLLSPRALAEFNVMAGQQFGGIGAKLGSRRDTTYLTGVIPGSPAEQAGLKAFDRVVAVNDTPVVGRSVDAVVERIRGPVGSALTLTVVRAGAAPVKGPLTRAPVGVPSVPGMAMLDGGIGVVRIAQFGQDAAREFAGVVDRLVETGGLNGLIIDVRSNPGGLLEEAMTIAAFFLPDGAPLVEIRPRPPQAVAKQLTDGPARYPATLPLAIVIDEQSASAAEVLAGALQDARRATVFGRLSYGKGSVQQLVPLAEGWSLKMTIAKWYTPAGRGLDRGAQPADVEIDPSAPHPGGVAPDVATRADTSAAPPKAALSAVSDSAWFEMGERLTDWTETVAREMATPGAPTSAAKAPAAIMQGLHVPAELEAPLGKWLSQRLASQAMGARYGEAAQMGYELTRDKELASVREWMAAHPGATPARK